MRGWRRHGEHLLHTTTRRCNEELLLLSIRGAAIIGIRVELIVGYNGIAIILVHTQLLLRRVRRLTTVDLAMRSHTIGVIHLRYQRLLLVSQMILILLVDHLCCRR